MTSAGTSTSPGREWPITQTRGTWLSVWQRVAGCSSGSWSVLRRSRRGWPGSSDPRNGKARRPKLSARLKPEAKGRRPAAIKRKIDVLNASRRHRRRRQGVGQSSTFPSLFSMPRGVIVGFTTTPPRGERRDTNQNRPPQQNLWVGETPFGQLFLGFSAVFDVVGGRSLSEPEIEARK
jgi:hypothetical protein